MKSCRRCLSKSLGGVRFSPRPMLAGTGSQMRDSSTNHYERAFESWLIDHQIEYVRADESKRIGTYRRSVKNFDFLLYGRSGRRIIVEVKGRTFDGTDVVEMKGFDCWVTRDDVASLETWCHVLGPNHEAVFVFAYRVTKVDVDFNGRDVLHCGPDRYLFLCVPLEDYRRHMKLRSPKWGTVTLSAARFREVAVDLSSLTR